MKFHEISLQEISDRDFRPSILLACQSRPCVALSTKRPRPLTAAEVAEWVRESMTQMLTDEQLAQCARVSFEFAACDDAARQAALRAIDAWLEP